MKETFELLMFKDGHQVALEDITSWTEEQLEKLLKIQEKQGRTWEYRKCFTFSDKAKEVNHE